MADDPSVTTWIALLRQGQSEAAEQLWQRYFARLVEFARGKLRGMSRAAADEEDVALSAFHSFCRAADRYPRLDNRLDLWRLLVTMTAHKAWKERRRQFTLKRGGPPGEQGPRYSPTSAAELLELDEIIGTEPSPDFAVLVAEHYQTLLERLPDDDLRLIARLRIEEATNAEIAAKLGCSERTVERRLALIRGYWEESL
jgi:DNA-directed RNA polymerase specialized sigma24 family protein